MTLHLSDDTGIKQITLPFTKLHRPPVDGISIQQIIGLMQNKCNSQCVCNAHGHPKGNAKSIYPSSPVVQHNIYVPILVTNVLEPGAPFTKKYA